jgi:hypothetical protein
MRITSIKEEAVSIASSIKIAYIPYMKLLCMISTTFNAPASKTQLDIPNLYTVYSD